MCEILKSEENLHSYNNRWAKKKDFDTHLVIVLFEFVQYDHLSQKTSLDPAKKTVQLNGIIIVVSRTVIQL